MPNANSDFSGLQLIFQNNGLPSAFSESPAPEFITCALDHTHHTKTNAKYKPEPHLTQVTFDAAEVFGPVPANPSNPIRSKKILQTFCHAREEGFVNSSDSSIGKFIDELIQNSRLSQHTQQDSSTSYKSTIPNEAHLVGEKGIGKTHFLNYVLTKYIERLNKSKVMWVRLSLSREFGTEQIPISIIDWFKAQLARIAIRYYDSGSSYRSPQSPTFQLQEHLTQFVQRQNLPKGAKKSLGNELVVMMARFLDKTKEIPIDPQWVNPLFADEIFSVLVRDGWTFLAVADQMDLLSHSVTMKAKYRQRRRQLMIFRAAVQNLPIFILLSRRPQSNVALSEEDELHREFLINSSNVSIAPADEYHLGAVDFRVFISKRMDYAKSTSRGSTEAEKASFQTADNVELLSVLQSEPVFRLAGSNLRSYVQLITTILVHNARVKDYEFTERAILLGFMYPRIPFIYERQASGTWTRRSGANSVNFDIMYLPSVFRFPYARDVKKAPGEFLMHYVLGLRILTLLNFLNGDKVNCLHLAGILEKCFGYDPDFTRLVLEEFVDFELVKAKVISHAGSHSSAFEGLALTPRGIGILNDYIFDPTYLAFCLQTLPIPLSVSARIVVKSPRDPETKTAEWVACKVYSALSFASLIRLAIKEEVRTESFITGGSSSAPVLGMPVGELVSKFNEKISEILRRIEFEVIKKCEKTINGLLPAAQQLDVMAKLRELLNSTRGRSQ